MPEPADEQEYDRNGYEQTRQKELGQDEFVDQVGKKRKRQQEYRDSKNPARQSQLRQLVGIVSVLVFPAGMVLVPRRAVLVRLLGRMAFAGVLAIIEKADD